MVQTTINGSKIRAKAARNATRVADYWIPGLATPVKAGRLQTRAAKNETGSFERVFDRREIAFDLSIVFGGEDNGRT